MSAQSQLIRAISVPPATRPVQAALRDAADALIAARRVLVVAHANPDGDAIASTLAMAWLCDAMNIEVALFNADVVPHNFGFLPGASRIDNAISDPSSFDLVCALDCAAAERLGETGARVAREAETLLVIDHHRERFSGAHIAVHDRTASATAELVYRLAVELRAPVATEFAECIYCGLLSDTGSFRYRSTTPVAMTIAAAALSVGVDPWHVASNVYESHPMEKVELLGAALQTLRRSPCGRLAAITLDRSLLARTGANDDLIDGIINHVRGIRGVEVAVQLLEEAPGHVVVSMRSRGSVELGPLAARLGGCGGRYSAHIHMPGPLDEVSRAIEVAFNELVDRSGECSRATEGP